MPQLKIMKLIRAVKVVSSVKAAKHPFEFGRGLGGRAMESFD
jgi:hypothetical protein